MIKKKESSVKKLEKKLYAKQNAVGIPERKHLSHSEFSTNADWQDEPIEKEVKEKPKRKKMTIFTKLLISAGVFFLASLLIAFLVITSGQNQVSYEQVTLSVLGSNTAAGGEVFSYDVIIQNDNDVDIELTDIIVKYPTGSFDPRESGVALSQEIRSIDLIPRGTSHTERFDVLFFGKEADVQNIVITYEYRVAGSNAILFKERVYQVKLESSPISLVVQAPKESLSGNDVEIEIEVISNANKQIENIVLEVEYPFGFEFTESAPAPQENTQGLFVVGTLGVGDTRTIKIFGSISGQDDETRVFKYRMGLLNQAGDGVENILQQAESLVVITRPPVSLTADLNGSQKLLHIIEAGSAAALRIGFANNLSSQIEDGTIKATITGNAFSTRSIESNGFYDSRVNEIVWQRTDVPQLGSLAAGAQGSVQATFNIFGTQELAGRVVDPFVDISYEFGGTTFDFENNKKESRALGATKIRIPTDLKLESRLVHSIGPFENEGPLQLTADVTSEYTLVWKVSNTTSQARDVEVSAILPPYVEFAGSQNKEDSVVEYNSLTRELTWTAFTVSAGAGYGAEIAPEIAIQLAITPSTSQIGDVLEITQDKFMKGFDTFTNTARLYPNLPEEKTDSLRTDPAYNGSAERVNDK